ncbi:MAG: c-type cytochrome [Gammaproteobacteria bacterium]|nr:c-type cytochrome [Gammaproteobacteria bacterium]
MAGGQSLKQGEKILFGIAIVFIVFAVVGYVMLETYRTRAQKPIFEVRTHYDLSELGHKGSELFRVSRCTACHRAMRNGTNMGLSLDGLGSKRSKEWIYDFLRDPEATYGAPTIDHGYPPKEAAYVSSIDQETLMAIATFLSELRADQGAASAPMPPEGRSDFIDNMVGIFAPEEWKQKYQDVREQPTPGQEESPQ